MATITGFLRASMNIEYWRSAARLDQTVTNARQKLFSHDDDDDDADDGDDDDDDDDDKRLIDRLRVVLAVNRTL